MDWTWSSLYAYTSGYAYTYAYVVPTSTIVIGLSVGLIKFSEYIQGMCISNTNLIIRQSDQIHFLLNRLIDLNKKIVRLENEITALTETNVSFTSLSTIDEVEEVDEEKEEEEEEEDQVEKEEKKEVSEEVFELIEKRLSPVTTVNKKSGWLSFLF
jgi:Ran GTPase-activating protein (RanGAP) involved in mRNA processing and transport